jgi:hypothetical protein
MNRSDLHAKNFLEQSGGDWSQLSSDQRIKYLTAEIELLTAIDPSDHEIQLLRADIAFEQALIADDDLEFEEWLSGMSDEELIAAMGNIEDKLRQNDKLADELGIPPEAIDELRTAARQFERWVEDEKRAHIALRESERRAALAADHLLASVDENEKPKPIYISSVFNVRKKDN